MSSYFKATDDNVEHMFRLWMFFGMWYLFLVFNWLCEVFGISFQVTNYLLGGISFMLFWVDGAGDRDECW